jgi:NADPH:quinone reductase-like Zn-dependent oxidoreductase
MEVQPVEGQRVLVFAASGGVGHVAVQLAKSLGLFTVGVAGPQNTVRGQPALAIGAIRTEQMLVCAVHSVH